MTPRITVTRDDITQGRRRFGETCPITIAGVRALHVTVRVNPRSMYVHGVRYNLPWRARLFVWLFDRALPVAPFSFQLRESTR